MNKKTILLLLVLIFYEIVSLKIFAQQDSTVVENTIFYKTKPLQIENYTLSISSIQIDPSYYQILQPTQFTKDYNFKYLTYDPVRDPRRLVYNTGLCVGASLLNFAFLWSLPESSTQWHKEELLSLGLASQWSKNLKSGPVWDEDGFLFNWVAHPWVGAVYYMNARGSGFKRWESFIYSTLMSTLFWEFGLENFVEIPSWQDIIITPVIGSLIGEVFFILKGKIIRNERNVLNSYILGRITLFIIDPFNELVDMFGYKTKNNKQIYATIAPVSYDYHSKKTILGIQVVYRF